MSILFTPARIGKLELPNRLLRSATAESMADEDGTPRDPLKDLYRGLAASGVGLTITGHMYVHPSGKSHPGMAGIHSDALLPSLAQLAKRPMQGAAKLQYRSTMMDLETTFIQTNGIKLHVVTAGPKDGQPILLLHGFPEFWYGWRKQIPVLAEAGYRVIVPDQRGYNLSDKPKGVKPYRIDMLVADILGLIETLGHQRVNLVGHDWGAAVAWELAIRHPERLCKLGILNVPHPAVMRNFLRRGDPEQLRRSWYIFAFQIPWLPEYILRKKDWRYMVRSVRGSGNPHTFTQKDMEEYKKAWSQPGGLTAMIHWYRAAARHWRKTRGNQRVKVPTLMLWGMNDVALSHRMARLSMDYCEDGKLVIFEEATHWVQHDEAEAVNQLLVEFLAEK